jgi:hypothetical protein
MLEHNFSSPDALFQSLTYASDDLHHWATFVERAKQTCEQNLLAIDDDGRF